MSLDFNTYQEQAATTAIYPRGELNVDRKFLLQVFRLSEYVGKIQGIVKKAIRDNGGTISERKATELMVLLEKVIHSAIDVQSFTSEIDSPANYIYSQIETVEPYSHSNLDLGQVYALLGLVNETGEVAEHVADCLESGEDLDVQAVAKELGDVEWYQNAIATDFGLKMEDIAQANLDKLFSRKERGTLQGSGDNR